VHLALIKYSVLRLAFFVASLALLWALGVRRSFMMLVLASAISLALSYLLLNRQRDAVAVSLSRRIEARTLRRAGLGQADADHEDAVVDAAERARQPDVRSEQPSDRQTDGQ
jgi:Protein of unknown function (DUF4229)